VRGDRGAFLRRMIASTQSWPAKGCKLVTALVIVRAE